MEDHTVHLSTDENEIIIEVPTLCQKSIITYDDAFYRIKPDLNLNQFKIIVKKSINKESTDVISVITDKYPKNIDIVFIWKGIFDGSMLLTISYDEMKLDKEIMHKQNPMTIQMLQYLDEELISLKIKDSNTMKDITISNKDLINFRIITNDDIYRYLESIYYQHDKSECYHNDDQCIASIIMNRIITMICRKSKMIATGCVLVENSIANIFIKNLYMMEYKGNSAAYAKCDGHTWMLNRLQIDKKFDKSFIITKNKDKTLIINGIIFHKFDIYKKTKDPVNNPVITPNINEIFHRSFKICNINHSNSRSNIQLSIVQCPYNYILMYYLEIKNNILYIVTDGILKYDIAIPNTQIKALTRHNITQNQKPSGIVMKGYYNSLHYNGSMVITPLNFQLDNVKLYPN